ncbi:MAG TPA: TRAP transporter large permease subunit [Hyphomicrobiaceae bacterium]|nr:TRAP transporter large permease subunit [Hyphomicrobiaceae bacterium]
MAGIALLGILTVLFGMGIYVSVAMGLGGLTLVTIFGDRPVWDIFGYVPWNTTTSFTLVALPLFVLMGEVLLRSGVTEGMYSTLSKWLNPLPGGLLHSNIAACAMFACISGSSAATAATIGGVSLPFLKSYGYSDRVAAGSLVAGGTLGILIPPSIVFIIYGVLVEESIGKLYLAGFVPGFMMAFAFMVLIALQAIRKPSIAPKVPPSTWRERLVGLGSLLPILFLMALVLGTIYTGVATATEAAAFGVCGAFLIAIVNRRISATMLRETFLASAGTTAMILFILIGAFVLQFILAFLGLPALISNWVISMQLTQMQVVLMICLLYIVLGTFMEELSMVVTTIPIFLPMLKALGVDLVWFGVVVVMLVQIAIVSPPVGMNLFILHALRRQLAGPGKEPPISDIFIGVMPFFFTMILTLVLVIMFPQIALWLPGSAK